VLTGSVSRLLHGGGLGLLLEEEAGDLDAVMSSSGLRLNGLCLLDDGLELSTEAAASVSSGMATTWGKEPTMVDEQCRR
jgi:hypothetical protein